MRNKFTFTYLILYTLLFALTLGSFTGICFANSSSATAPKVASSKPKNNTKVDWWLVRGKNHAVPGVNDSLPFKYETYDAYYVGDTSRPVLYLTFDEGYEKGYTAEILDILKANDVKAIFFVTSPYITTNKDLIQRMVFEGHIVANHSKSHPSMPKYANEPEKFKEQLEDVATKYQEATGNEMIKLFRPPMGHYSEKSLALTKALGYKTVFWSFAYADFDLNRQPSKEYGKKMILNNLHNGGILLLHAISRTNVDILDEVLKEAKNMGYTFELFE